MVKSVILVIAIVLLISSSASAQTLKFEHPYTPQEYMDEKIKGRIGPEIKTFVGALAGILVVKFLVFR